VERHGNATKPFATFYYRRDPSVFEEIHQQLDVSNKSPDEIYAQFSKKKTKKNDGMKSVSETISNP